MSDVLGDAAVWLPIVAHRPFPKLSVAELSKVAKLGANVIAMVDDSGHATVLRPNFY